MSKISTVYKKLLTASCLLFFSFFANAQIIETYSITCPGAGDGQLTVTANFCKSTPEYKWSTGDTTATVNGLTAGDYSVRIICQEEVTERFDSITEKTDTVKALVADTVQIADYEQRMAGVKAEKKVEPKKLTVGNVTFYYDEGQTFTEAKQKYADLNSGWILNGPYISVQGSISIVLFKGESPVEGTSKIEPNAEYSWIDFS